MHKHRVDRERLMRGAADSLRSWPFSNTVQIVSETRVSRGPQVSRSTMDVAADWLGYNFRVLSRRQDPVRLKNQPRDLQLLQVSFLIFLALTPLSLVTDAAWLDFMQAALFVITFGLAYVSMRRGRQDLRFTVDWSGSVGR